MRTYPFNNEVIEINEVCYMGDPCYVIPYDKWDDFCDLMFDGENEFNDRESVRVFELDTGEKSYWFGTAHGDGVYYLEENHGVVGEMGVDAGMLSIIPRSFLNKVLTDGGADANDAFNHIKSRRLGVVKKIDMKDKMNVSNGDFTFGTLKMETSK